MNCYIGVGSAGVGQAIVSLTHGQSYYTNVRAITGAGNVLDSGSNGFTLDVSPPEVYIDGIGIVSVNDTEDAVNLRATYQTSESMAGAWTIVDEESEVVTSTFFVGSYPGGIKL